MRKRIRTCVWYSLILSPSTTAEVSKTSIPSMPRSVFAASWRAAWAASRHDCVDTPTRSMVLMTDIRTPCSRLCLRDCRGRARGGAKNRGQTAGITWVDDFVETDDGEARALDRVAARGPRG